MDSSDKEVRYRTLIDLGIALSAERDHNRLMEKILHGAKAMVNADGGTLYLVDDSQQNLRFEIMLNDSLGLAMGGTTGTPIPFPPVRLQDEAGQPNHNNVASHCALTAVTVTIADAYHVERFDFSGTKAFDRHTGYRSQSFLTVPLRNYEGTVMGVLQLINARDSTGAVIEFGAELVPLIEALSSQAAVALDNQRLIASQKTLFKSLTSVIAGAIDAKSPYTGGHCHRVPALTMMLARAACTAETGPFADFTLDEEEWYELDVAARLHDCGKVTTPEHIVDKATKLETIYNRIHEVRMRFEVCKRDAEIACLEGKLAGLEPPEELERRRDETLAALDSDFAFLAECNIGGETMAPERIARLEAIATRTWVRTLDDRLGLSIDELRRRPGPVEPPPVVEPLLSDRPWHLIPHETPIDLARYEAAGITLRPLENRYNLGEIYNLKITRGTLTAEDRFKINDHIVQTLLMLKALPFPRPLARVAEWAGGHHEKMDGTGYPRGLTRDEMALPARMMAIADIFEALTAADRPYKKPKTLSDSLQIMAGMARDRHIDPDLWRLFLETGVWQEYATTHLRPEQIDAVNVAALLAQSPP